MSWSPGALRLAVATLFFAACGPAEVEHAPAEGAAIGADLLRDLRTRTGLVLARADFLKPRMDDPTAAGGLDPYLAPLIYREVRAGEGPATASGRLGALGPSSAGPPAVDGTRPTVYYGRETVRVAGRDRRTLVFLWYRPTATGPVAQGLRATLAADGRPLVFEVLADSSGACLLYVTESLEERARRAFGEALPGRRFAIEADPTRWPDVIVARVVPAGPVPMGPFVYAAAGTGDLTSLHCRCQPSQVGEQRELVEYELVPLARAREAGAPPPTWPVDGRGGLGACLRWPAAEDDL